METNILQSSVSPQQCASFTVTNPCDRHNTHDILDVDVLIKAEESVFCVRTLTSDTASAFFEERFRHTLPSSESEIRVEGNPNDRRTVSPLLTGSTQIHAADSKVMPLPTIVSVLRLDRKYGFMSLGQAALASLQAMFHSDNIGGDQHGMSAVAFELLEAIGDRSEVVALVPHAYLGAMFAVSMDDIFRRAKLVSGPDQETLWHLVICRESVLSKLAQLLCHCTSPAVQAAEHVPSCHWAVRRMRRALIVTDAREDLLKDALIPFKDDFCGGCRGRLHRSLQDCHQRIIDDLDHLA